MDALSAISSTLPADKSPVRAPNSASEEELRAVAKQFESVFIAEMLKHTGLEEPAALMGEDSFTGGPGEAAFRSFLTREYADELSDNGALGLADTIYEQLKARQEAASSGGAIRA